jgi:crotonobetaine/carnitine-CoA ligase
MTSEVRALPPAQRTLPAMLQRQSALFGARPLLRVAGRQWTHGDAAEPRRQRAGALAQAGVARGDRIAVMCGNRIEFLETFLGAGWMGAVGRCRSTRPRWGRRSNTSWPTARRGCW